MNLLLIIIFCCVCLLYFFLRNIQRRIDGYNNQKNEYLKTQGEKIFVKFSQCEIKENLFFEQTEKPLNKSDAYGEIGKAMFNEPEYKPTQQSRYSTVLSYVYNNPRSGNIEVFNSDVITKDKITLSFLLEEKKSTNIYVDRNDRKKYFFDLDFLS